MGFRMVNSTEVWLVLNLVSFLMPLWFHILFGAMLYTVVSSTAADPEVFIRLIMSRNSNI